MATKDILRVVPPLMAVSLVTANARFAMKKKKKASDFLKVGAGTIIGVALAKETADFIEGF